MDIKNHKKRTGAIIRGIKINEMSDFSLPEVKGFSFSGSFSSTTIWNATVMPSMPKRCEIISGNLFRRRTLSFLAGYTDFKDGTISGNIIGKLEDRTEFTRLFNILVTAGYILICFGFIYFN